MPRTMIRPAVSSRSARRVAPSIVDPAVAAPFTLDQELAPFGSWTSDPIWAPPKDASEELAETMLRQSRWFASRASRWTTVVEAHRDKFTQVRQIDLRQASIRLPQGKFFVTVTEQQDFDKIEETIPACVQTRLDEFLAGPGRKRGTNVYYLKPLCLEIGDQLILTTREDLTAAIEKVQDEVFAAYRRRALTHRPLQALDAVVNASLALPRAIIQTAVRRRQKALDALHAHYEFKRRKMALSAMNNYRKRRTSGCTFDDMLELTTPIDRTDVIEQYCLDEELSRAQRKQLLLLAAGTVPWFVAMSLTASFLASVATAAATYTVPVATCDPAFVAERPDSPGVLWKIGHFDEVDGVLHVEI